ncbi:hypothetical protein Tsubulata_039721 [Turnera subulata]|uniref:Uncharacterized protein n=1 Tax=Turnera subulata TaxID=218843 RepID=A0A9Q0FI81_9ROSI|nr:hypothetical protein Tsubulata_039721 [Turnera subulata]
MASRREIDAGGHRYIVYFSNYSNTIFRCRLDADGMPCLKNESHTDVDLFDFEEEPNPAFNVCNFYRCLGGNVNDLEEFDIDSSDLRDFMPLFAQIGLDCHHPLGNLQLYLVKIGNVCCLRSPNILSIHFNFWATHLPPSHDFDPTLLSTDDPKVYHLYGETDIFREYGFNVRACSEVEILDDKITRDYCIRSSYEYGEPCSVCVAAEFNPPVLHAEYI